MPARPEEQTVQAQAQLQAPGSVLPVPVLLQARVPLPVLPASSGWRERRTERRELQQALPQREREPQALPRVPSSFLSCR